MRMYYLTSIAWRNGSILPDYLLAFGMIMGRYRLNNPKMLTNAKIKLGPSPFKIIDIAIMIDFPFLHNFKFGFDVLLVWLIHRYNITLVYQCK